MANPPITGTTLTTAPILTDPSSPQLQLMAASPKSSNMTSQNTVSMPFIKRHVTRRLKAAKQECDKELTSLTNSITTFFEEKLRDSEGSREIFSENPSTDELDRPSSRRPRESILSASPRLKQLNPDSQESSSDDGEYHPDPDSIRQYRQGMSCSPAFIF